MNKIYSLFGGNLGDIWASISFILNEEKSNNINISCSYVNRIRRKFKIDFNKTREICEEIVKNLDIDSNKKIIFTEEYPNQIITRNMAFSSRYIKTKKTWEKNGNLKNVICLQLKGFSKANIKNCKDEDISKIKSHLKSSCFCTMDLGLPLTIEQNIEAMLSCKCLVCVCSGMSHIGHSVGCPVYIIRNGMSTKKIGIYHENKEYLLFNNVEDFIKNAKL